MSSTPEQPGKVRTWWHPLLAGLRWQLSSHYHLEEEVSVGQKPLQIDILLLRKEDEALSEEARKILAGLVDYFAEYTMLELKSPSETLRAGDFHTFLAYALLYRALHDPLLDVSKVHLVVVAPRLTKPYQKELETLEVTMALEQPGVWSLRGGLCVHAKWVLETEVLSGLNHPLLTLFSPQFLRDRQAVYEQLRQSGYSKMVVYMAQQIQQFRQRGQEFAMQHLGSEDEMKQAWHDLLASLTPEERLEGLSPEERLRGLAPEAILRGLPPEELERLRQLLQEQAKTDNSSRQT